MNEDRPPESGWLQTVRGRLIVYLTIAFTVILIVSNAVALWGLPGTAFDGRRGAQRAEIVRSLNLIADLKKERLVRLLKERADDAEALAANTMLERNVAMLRSLRRELESQGLSGPSLWSAVRAHLAYARLSDYVRGIRRAYGVYVRVLIVDAETKETLVATDEIDLGTDNTELVPIIETCLAKRGFISDVTLDRARGITVLYVCHVISGGGPETSTTRSGDPATVLVMELDSDDIIKPILESGEGLGPSGESLLVNQDGRIVTQLRHPLPDGTIPRPLEWYNPALPARLAAGGGEGIIEAADYRGRPVLAAYRHIRISPEYGWGLVVKRDSAEAYAPLRRDMSLSLVIGLLSIFGAAGLTVGIAGGVTRPILALSSTARKVALGDLRARAPVFTMDEIGTLARTFNEMVQRIEEWHGQLEQQVAVRTAELDRANQELRSEIEERRRVEATLRESEERYRLLFETSPDAVMIHCDEKIVLANPAAARLFGAAAPEAIVGRRIFDLVHPDYREIVMERIRVMRDRRIPVPLMEQKIVRLDGTSVGVEVVSAPHVYEGKMAVQTIARDITERLRAEEAARESQRMLMTLMSNLPGMVYRCRNDRNWTMEFVSDGCRNLTGYTPRDLTDPAGVAYGEIIHPDDRDEVWNAVQLAIGKGEPFQINYRIITAEGMEKWVWEQGRGVAADGGTAEVLEGFITDITEQKRAEREREEFSRMLEEKNSELESIINATSHDLRAPLVNIHGFAEELGRACEALRAALWGKNVPEDIRKDIAPLLDEDIPEALRFIRAGASKMDSLLAGLLRISRLGRVSLKLERLDMNALLTDVLHGMEYQIQQAGAKILVGELPACIGDAGQINQVFSNLIDNALKYRHPDRPAVIEISGLKQGGRAVYCVRDNGVGIAPQHRERVFELFQRLQTTGVPGEGLGLAIVRRILGRHNGTIKLESEPGAGSRFFVSLPLADVEAK